MVTSAVSELGKVEISSSRVEDESETSNSCFLLRKGEEVTVFFTADFDASGADERQDLSFSLEGVEYLSRYTKPTESFLESSGEVLLNDALIDLVVRLRLWELDVEPEPDEVFLDIKVVEVGPHVDGGVGFLELWVDVEHLIFVAEGNFLKVNYNLMRSEY